MTDQKVLLLKPYCRYCGYIFDDCECGNWDAVYLNEYDYLKHRRTGKIYKVEEHFRNDMTGVQYFIVLSKFAKEHNYPKRLIKNYEDFFPSTKDEYEKNKNT